MYCIITRSWRRSALLALGGVTFLAGCSDNSQAPPPAAPSSTPTAVRTATATIPAPAPTATRPAATTTPVPTGTEAPATTATPTATPTGTAEGTATPTPTTTLQCDTADLAVTLSGASGDFNGDATSFVVDDMNTALEQKAPDNIPGIHDTYNSIFNGSACAGQRNIQVSLFGALGGIAAGQSFPINSSGVTPVALVYYGQAVDHDDGVWSASTGTVFIDSVEGSVVTLRVVGASMTETSGTATGSFTLDVSGQVQDFTKQ